MKISQYALRAALAGATLVASAGAFASTGGGATIHNAATLTYNSGQQVTAWVDVDVMTIGTAPSFALETSGPFTVNAGETITLTYSITANSNGTDSYSLSTATSTTTGMTAGTTFTPSTNTVTLGASVTAAPSAVVDGDTGTIYIPAGSETNIAVGDTVVINGFEYTVESVTPGTVASTVGNTTTAETYTAINLTVPLGSGSPSIGNATIAVGTQVGEQQTFTIDVTVSAPTTVGTDGEVSPAISGNTSALDTNGDPASFDTATDGDNTNDPSITVLSATVSITKEARNVTKGGVFATSGVNAQTGDTLEYRITMEVAAGTGDAVDSVLTDEVPDYTTYVASSTTLNGAAVTDDAGAVAFPLSSTNSGLGVNSVNGAADQANGGTLVDGDTGVDAAVILFRVTVD